MAEIIEGDIEPPTVAFPRHLIEGEGATAQVHGIGQDEIKILGEYASAAKSRAHCPYSSFRVGACLLTKSNDYIIGCNFENASTPVGICAERCALGAAIAGGGHSRGSFRAVGVSSDLVDEGDGSRDGYCSPCGMCRQALREFCEETVPIFMFDASGKYIVRTMGELLPLSFGPEKLAIRKQRQTSS